MISSAPGGCDFDALGLGAERRLRSPNSEPVARLHPAIVRPRRCIAQIEVGKLSASEARRWLGGQVSPQGGDATPRNWYACREGKGHERATSSEASVGQHLHLAVWCVVQYAPESVGPLATLARSNDPSKQRPPRTRRPPTAALRRCVRNDAAGRRSSQRTARQSLRRSGVPVRPWGRAGRRLSRSDRCSPSRTPETASQTERLLATDSPKSQMGVTSGGTDGRPWQRSGLRCAAAAGGGPREELQWEETT